MKNSEECVGPLPVADFRRLCRGTDRVVTTVEVYLQRYYRWLPWLTLGEVDLRHYGNRDFGETWELGARMVDFATDSEHDTAWVLKIPLVCLKFDSMSYGRTVLTALVNPNAGGPHAYDGDFRLPSPDYDPLNHPKTRTCSGKSNKKDYCKFGDGKPHKVLPEGMYLPPHDEVSYQKVRGMPVRIQTGKIHEEEA